MTVSGKPTVGILTFHGADNYGAVLQAYALSKWLTDHGCHAEIADYRIPEYDQYRTFRGIRYYLGSPKTLVLDILSMASRRRRSVRFRSFRKQYLPISDRCWRSAGELAQAADQYDVWICGSDQIWNPTKVGSELGVFLLDFAGPGNRKVSYAPSMGVSRPEPEEMAHFVRSLSGFHAVSVREADMAELFSPYVGAKIWETCDPVFLLGDGAYDSMDGKPRLEPYVFLYVVGSAKANAAMIRSAETYSERHGLRLYYIIDGNRVMFRVRGKSFFGCSPEEFLSLIRQAEHVISNSFHATAFSLLFKKSFVTYRKTGTAGRMGHLLERFGMTDRLCGESDDIGPILDRPIEHRTTGQACADIRTTGESFLTMALDI